MPFDGAFSPVHILIVAFVALIALGPEQLPKVARQLGQGLQEFQRVRQHLTREFRDVVSEFDGTARSDSDLTSSSIPMVSSSDEGGAARVDDETRQGSERSSNET
jgi:TatA/E family protein of Tat protein translocase